MTREPRDGADVADMRAHTQPEPFVTHCTRIEALRVLHVWQPTWGSLRLLIEQEPIGEQPLRASLVADCIAQMHARRWPQSPAATEVARQAVQLFGPPRWKHGPSWVIRIDNEMVRGWATLRAWTPTEAMRKAADMIPGRELDAEVLPDPATKSGQRMQDAIALYPGERP